MDNVENEEEIQSNLGNLTMYPYLEYLLEPTRIKKNRKNDGHQLSFCITNPHLDMYYNDYLDEDQVIKLQEEGLDDEQICELEIKKRLDYINSHYNDNDLNRLLDETLYEEQNINVPTSKSFINNIFENKKISIDRKLIEESEPCCGICQSAFKEGDEAIMLPCKNSNNRSTPHYFHTGNNPEECLGIKPWLKANNTCPICRFSLPSIKDNQEEIKIEEIEEDTGNFSMDHDDIVDCITILSNIYVNSECRANPSERCLHPKCIEKRERLRIDKVNKKMVDKAVQVSIEESILSNSNNCLLEEQKKILEDIDLNANEDAILESIILQSLENY